MSVQKPWQKRLAVLEIIYADIMADHTNDGSKVMSHLFEHENFDVNQLKILEHYFENYQAVDNIIIPMCQPTWRYERISPLTKALIQCAYHEFQTLKTDKAILINEALKTCDKRGEIRDKKFINAILDRILIYGNNN
ncbi:transcription termination factor [Candidatus Malacoplasma girerdii]|uniref:Transcription termination factor n=1 Tax=Candidatus Malacoplasma girerdii TaxID=1318617 RepID=A0A097ST52_9BACT|nr:transcription termination factor [Candidatus Malacoplasma girerdii]ASJ89287.1 MAG: transcription termination factor NusB [Candidatus Malacoplasma girerdii]